MNLKTHKGAAKRFRVLNKNGGVIKIKAKSPCMRHKMLSKSMNAKRDDRACMYVSNPDAKRIMKYLLAA